MKALSSVAALLVFVLIVWVMLLVLGRRAAMAFNDLRGELTAWAGRRHWTTATEPRHPLSGMAGAEQVAASARGVLNGHDCTVLYCTAFESAFVACALRLPAGSGQLTLRRRGRMSKVAMALRRSRPDDFNRAYRVVLATGDGATVLSPPVRSALARAAGLVPVREFQIVNDLAMIKAETWTVQDHLDPLINVLTAIAQATPTAPPPIPNRP
jgi:hypothetical protein